MIGLEPLDQGASPAQLRLGRFANLSRADVEAIRLAEQRASVVRARREMLAQGQEINGARLIFHGWAARVHALPDGRRQFINFLLPGDVIDNCRHARPLAPATVIAMTDVVIGASPPSGNSPALRQAFAVGEATEAAYLFAQIVRLGRLTALERIADLMLELHERLDVVGMVKAGSFEVPLTQEVLADALGLTSVHINRMLQLMRREGDLNWKQGRVTLPDAAALSNKIGRSGIRVAAAG